MVEERLAGSDQRVDSMVQESLGSRQHTLDQLLKHATIDSRLQQALFETVTAIDAKVEASIASGKLQVSTEQAVLTLACGSLRAEIDKEELASQGCPRSSGNLQELITLESLPARQRRAIEKIKRKAAVSFTEKMRADQRERRERQAAVEEQLLKAAAARRLLEEEEKTKKEEKVVAVKRDLVCSAHRGRVFRGLAR